jgi:uncharacterized membrane protein YsdA (DUF1294 family)
MDWIKQHGLAALIGGYLLVISLITFVQYGWDKRQARKQKRRIPEKRLHLLALAGGTPGALLGQLAFRHKTQKKRFRIVFWGTVMLQAAVIVGILYLIYRG